MAKKAVKRVTSPKKAANAAAEREKKEKLEAAAKQKAEKSETEKETEVKQEKSEPVKTDDTEKVEQKEEKVEKVETEVKDEKEEELNETGDGNELDETTETDHVDDEPVETTETEKKTEKERAESPLNILIGEEEENLLLNSGDEHETADNPDKTQDEKIDETSQNETKESVTDDKEDRQDKEQSDTLNESSNTANDSVNTSANVATTGDADQEKTDDKNKNNKATNPGRSLWVTNLLPSTRAQELKHLLSRYGKVIGAKVVQSSRHPRTRCYGYVTMETRAAADLCIEKLNNTELKGQIIRVAKVRPEHSLPLKSVPETSDSSDKSKTTPKPEDKSAEKKKESSLSAEKKSDDKSVKKESKERDHKSRSSSRKGRSVEKSSSAKRDRKTDVLTFDKIREERDRHRARERERAAREEEKRRREIQRAREIERRQREEAQRLEREREKLRLERERLDRQRQEILRLERERQKLEREKLEQEKQELRRQQMRLEEARRPLKRPASTSATAFRRDATGYPDDRKREAREERHYEEAPPPPRFEVPARETVREVPKKEVEKDYKPHVAYSKHSEEYAKRGEYKREFPATERHYGSNHMVHAVNNGSSSKYEGSSQYVNREREMPNRREVIGPSVGPPKISSEVRYERPGDRSPVSYSRGVREERDRRPISEHHSKEIRSSRDHRYADPVSNMKDGGRYREGNSWHSGGPSPTQAFGGMSGPNSSSRESWSKGDNWRPIEANSNERWVSNSSSRIMMSGSSGVPSAMYSAGNSSGLSCPPPPGSSSYTLDRFDNYKSMSNPRKY